MKSLKKITASVLCAAVFFSALSVQIITSFAASNEPSETVEYKISEMTALSQLTKDDNIKLISGGASPDASLKDGVLTLGGKDKLSKNIVLLNPYNDKANNLKYPVSGYSACIQLGELANSGRCGTVFYFAKSSSETTENSTVTTVNTYNGNTVNIYGSAEGLRIKIQGVVAKHTVNKNGSDITESFTSTHEGDSVSKIYTSEQIAGFITSDETQKAQIIAELSQITEISESERFAQAEFFYQNNDVSKPVVSLKMKLAGRNYSFDLPLYNLKATKDEKFYAFGSTYHQWPNPKVNNATEITTLSVKYDLSEYYAPILEELENKISNIGTMKKEKLSEIQAVYAEYEALPEVQKAYVKNIDSVINALKAFDNGAFVYDDFESGNLNWQLKSRITSGDYAEDLTETNIYSEEAAAYTGDSDKKAFWGIHSSSESSDNKVLWLRKTFNADATRPIMNNNQNKPSVIAVTKDLLPENAKIAYVTGKMYIDTVGAYKKLKGITFKYADEYSWECIGLNGANPSLIRSVYRTNAEKGQLNNTFNNYEVIEGEDFSENNKLAQNQWIDFALEYDFLQGCYTYKITGLSSENSEISVTIKLNSGTALLSEVGLINAGDTAQSFDNISIGLVNSDFAEKRIADLPSAESLTLDDENLVLEVKSILERLSDDDKSNIANMDYYDSVYNKYSQLAAVRDGGLDINKIITFEDSQAGKDYFESIDAAGVYGWGVKDNPNKTGINTSEKVLQITRNYNALSSGDPNRAIYKIKDSVMNGKSQLSNVSGKVFVSSTADATIVYDYVDKNNWNGFQIYVLNNKIAAYTVSRINGSNLETSSRSTLSLEQNETHSVPASGIWLEFNIDYELLKASLTVRYVVNGKEYVGQYNGWKALNDTNETKIGFCTAKTTYIDDIKVNFKGTDDYTSASKFLKDNEYILNLIPVENYISVTDKPYVEKVVNEYNALSDTAKAYIPFINTKIAEISTAFAALDQNSQQAAADKALLDYKNSITGNYDSYVVEDDFEDGLRKYQPARQTLINTGTVTTEYNDKFGSKVLKMSGVSTITLKDTLLPNKPQLKEVYFKILREPTEKQDSYYRLRIYPSYINDDDFCGYGFYKNPNDDSSTNYRVVYPTRSISPVNCKLDMNSIWNVSIIYESTGKYIINIKDENENTFVNTSTADVQSVLALASFGKTTYIDDLKVVYTKGNYDIDEVNDNITVYYTGNTLQSAGDYVTLSGENLADNVAHVEIAPVSNETQIANKGYVSQERFDFNGVSAGEYTADPKTHAFNQSAAKEVKIVQKTTDSVKFLIPSEFSDGSKPKSAIYAVKLTSSLGAEKIIYINNPVIDYTVGSDGAIASKGTDIRVIGKNLSPDNSVNNMKAVLQKGSTAIETKVTEVQSDYSVSVHIPENIANGEYELWLYSGYGDNTCWAIPYKITVDNPIRDSWSQTVFNIKDYGAEGIHSQNATPCFVNALSAIAKNGGGILYIPKGVYSIENDIIIPNNCRVIGEDVESTSIILRPFNWAYGKLPAASFKFEKNVEISNLSIIASRAGGIFKAYGDSSDNIYLNNLYTYIQPIAGAVSSAPHDIVGLLPATELNAMIQIENVSPVISFSNKGDNVQIKDCDFGDVFSKARRPIVNDTNGSVYWQVDNIKTSYGWSEVIVSKSLWENSEHGPNSALGVWGHGLYFANNYLKDRTENNRELYVADRNASYAGKLVPVEGDETGTQFITNEYINPVVTELGQIYIRSGQGVGQTRTVIKGEAVNINDVKVTKITIDRPFTIKPNKNSNVIIRKPRENIYFVNNSYENGACGGFYGGFADVVYDNCEFYQVVNFYQQGIFSDVNWYLSIINTSLKYRSSLGSVSQTDPYGQQTGFDWQALSGTNAQMCFTMRDCKQTGLTSYIRSNGKDYSVDFVLQRNEWINSDYAIKFFANMSGNRYENINGFLMADNIYTNVDQVFESNSQLIATAAKSTTNSSSSKRMIILDKDIGFVDTGIAGDANGDGETTLKDATIISMSVIGKIVLTETQIKACDVNGDGVVNLKDATLIKLYVLGQIQKFPVEEKGDSGTEDESSDSSESGNDINLSTPSDIKGDDWTEKYY